MRTTIDRAGRVVIPKPLRDALDIGAGQEVEIQERDGCIEIAIPPTPMHLTKRGKGLVAVPEGDLPSLTPETVRQTVERIRR